MPALTRKRLNITLSDNTVLLLSRLMEKNPIFREKSALIEYAIIKLESHPDFKKLCKNGGEV